MNILRPLQRLVAAAVLASSVFFAAAGCTFFHNLGSGQRMDDPRPIPHHVVNAKNRDLLVEITTDANGAVIQIQFKRSSGSEAVDNYVAENIRTDWPGVPSTRALVELNYSASKGFSEPKLISSSPAP